MAFASRRASSAASAEAEIRRMLLSTGTSREILGSTSAAVASRPSTLIARWATAGDRATSFSVAMLIAVGSMSTGGPTSTVVVAV
jgi:hypothetical protein